VTCGKVIDPAVLAYAASSTGSAASTPTPESGKHEMIGHLYHCLQRRVLFDETAAFPIGCRSFRVKVSGGPGRYVNRGE
jgi:hypothetical protein